MKIIIIGNGRVGEVLTKYIAMENHDIVVIDTDSQIIENITDKYDANGIVGNGASYSVQKQAGVQNADLLIAVTSVDEVNIMCCKVAKKLGAKNTIARVRDTSYIDETAFLKNEMGVDMIVNPESQAAHIIMRLIKYPAVLNIEAFASGHVDLAEINIAKDSPLVGVSLKNLRSIYASKVIICAVLRDDEVFIPTADYVFCANDTVSIVASHPELSGFLNNIGIINKPIKSVMIIGGGRIGNYLAMQLESTIGKVKIIESDRNRCLELSERFPKIEVVYGDGTDSSLLIEEGIEKVDACASLTGNDETNLVVSLFAHSHGVKKIITEIHSLEFAHMLHDIEIDDTISPQYITIASVLRYLRGIENSKLNNGGGNSIKTLYKMIDDKAEALEFNVTESFKKKDILFMSPDFKLKKNTIIASIIRNGSVIFPHGSTTLKCGDCVVVVTTNSHMTDLNDILA